jgi:acetolactate synthase-1/2/3 large subunit
MNGGEMLVRALEREGVHEIFTLHGGHLDAIFKACLEHNLRVIDTATATAAHGRRMGALSPASGGGDGDNRAGVTDAVTGASPTPISTIPMI